MKFFNQFKNKAIFFLKQIINIIGLVALIFFSNSCDKFNTSIDETKTYYDEDELSITQYFISKPDEFSILSDILDTTHLDHLFRTYGDYTFLAPTDDAFKAYFGKSTYLDYTTEELIELIKYHIFDTRIMAGAFNSGIINQRTLSGERMVSTLSDDGSDIYLNKNSKITYKDMILPNGIVHTVDKVVVKPQYTIYTWLKSMSDFSIMLEAVEETGLDVALNQLQDTNSVSKTFYTCFFTPDDIFKANKINSFLDLAKLISPDSTNYKDSSNELRKYIASHYLNESISISDASEEHVYYGTEGKATLKFGLRPNSAEVVLNYQTIDFPNGLDVNEFNSNNLSQNGIIHIMDTIYLVTKTFQRERVVFIYMDVPGMPYDSILDYSQALYDEPPHIIPKASGNGHLSADDQALGAWSEHWPRPEDGVIHVPFEKTNGWLTLNSPYSAGIYLDAHRTHETWDKEWAITKRRPLNLRFLQCENLLDITRKLPYIIPGKYEVGLEVKKGTGRPSIKNYFDGKPIGGLTSLEQGTLDFDKVTLGVVEIEEGELEHTLRTVTVTPGNGFYVCIIFEPID